MRQTILNKAYLAVLYYNITGSEYDINDYSDREKARHRFKNTKKLDSDILSKAFEKYLEMQETAFQDFAQNSVPAST